MTEASRGRIHREFETDNVEWISTATTLRPGSRSYVIDTSAAAVVVTLPDMAECVGNIISFYAPSAGSFDASIFINETGAELSGCDLDTDADNVVLYCNGLIWVVLYNGVV